MIGDGTARVDGLFFVDMKYEGKLYPHYGRYLRLEAPSLVEFTWMSQGTRGEETRVRIDIDAKGAESEIRLTHEGILDEKEAKSHEGGWSEFLDILAKRLAPARA
jgi:uncharacterized protein YndB with AHSA1/START domain